MMQAVSFEATTSSAHGLLLQVALALREYKFTPESLVWSSAPDRNIVKVRIVIPPGCKTSLRTLADRLQEIPGVLKVEPQTLAAPAFPPDGPSEFTD